MKRLLLFLGFFLLLSGCAKPEKVVLESLQDVYEYNLDFFSLENIQIKSIIKGEEGLINLDESMLSNEDLEKLNQVGLHEITINYQGKNITIKLDLYKDIYQVKYIYNNGLEDLVINQVKDSLLEEPTTPHKDNYDFLGWYYKALCDGVAWNFETDVLKNDLVLEARWQLSKKLVRFLNDEEVLYETEVSYGDKVPDYLFEVNANEIFVGFLDSNEKRVEYVYENLDLYAQVYEIKNYDFKYSIKNNYVYITGIVNNTTKNLVIPSHIYGLEVVAINDYAFMDNNKLESVVLPNTIRKIGRYAFGFCVNLNSINIPSNAIVYEKAFYFTKMVEGIDFFIVNNVLLEYYGEDEIVIVPDGVEKIASKAFYYKNVIEVKLPNSVTEIETEAFAYSNLINVEIPASVKTFGADIFKGTPWLKNQDSSIIFNNYFLTYIGSALEYKIPEGVEKIATNAFFETSLSRITVPASVVYINDDAFDSKIDEIVFLGVLPDFYSSFVSEDVILRVNLTQDVPKKYNRYYVITKDTTYDASYEYRVINDEVIITRYLGDELKIVIPDEIKGKKVVALGAYAFFESLIEEVTLPKDLRIIYPYAFYSSLSLNKVNFNENLEHLSYYVFGRCKNLKTLNLPESIKSLDTYALGGFGLENLTLDNVYYKTVDNVLYTSDLRTLIFYPNGIKDSEFEILESVYRLSYGAFIMAQNIKVLTFSTPYLPLYNEVAFYPEIVIKAKDDLFDKYNILYGLMTNEVYKEKDFAGDFCIINNALVKYIGNDEEVIIPENVTTIEANAFQGYGNPKRVIINHSLMIKNYALTYMRDLESITLNAFCTVDSYAIPITAVLLVEEADIVLYKAMINVIEEYLIISKTSLIKENDDFKYVIYNNKAMILKYLGNAYDLIIPEKIDDYNVTYINNNAFVGSSVRIVDLPKTIEKLGAWVFASSNLEVIIFRSLAVPNIKDSTFSYDEKLEIYVLKERLDNYKENINFSKHLLFAYDEYVSSEGILKYIIYDNQVIIKGHTNRSYEIEIPSEISGYPVTTIASDAFKNSLELKKLVLPKTVKKVEANAFSGCINLESITLYSEELASIGFINLNQLSSNFSFKILASVHQDFILEYPDLEDYVSRFGILITFHSMGGSRVKSITKLDSYTLPKNPYKLGYEFLGWTNFSGEAIDFDAIETDTVVYAKWQENTTVHTVSFVTNTEALIEPIEKIYNDTIDMIIMPYRETYHLEGWYLEEDFQTKITFPFAVTSNCTLYAKWISVVRDGSTFENAYLLYKGINTISSNLIKTYYAFYPLDPPYDQDKVYIFRSLEVVNVIIYLYDIYGNEMKFNYGGDEPFYLDQLLKQQYIYYIAFEKLDSSVSVYQVEVD
ncbi:MAG: leucine-rich repeat protein [Bacilli bacterium]